MNSFTSNSEKEKSEGFQAGRFLMRYLLPFICIIGAACIAWDYILLEAVVFRTDTLGAAKLNRAFDSHPGEIPIYGSSRALGSYIPDSIAPNVYNYGINGIGYRVIDLFLEEEISSGNSGPIILNYDYGMFLGHIGDNSSYLPLTNVPQVREMLKQLNLYEPYYRIPGIRLYGAFDSYFRDFLNQRMQLTKWVTKGAAIEKNKLSQANFDKLVQQRMENPEEWKPDSNLTKALEQRIAQGANRRFWIVVAPYHNSYHRSFNPDSWNEAQQYLRKLDQFPNVEVVEISGKEWPDSLFVNTTHLNLNGAIRFCRELRLSMAEAEKDL